MRIPSVAICTLAVLTVQDLKQQSYAASSNDLPDQKVSQQAASSHVVPVTTIAPVSSPETVAMQQTVVSVETIAPIVLLDTQSAEPVSVPVAEATTVVPTETVVAEQAVSPPPIPATVAPEAPSEYSPPV